MSIKKAVILLSGGLDSSTTLAIAKSEGFEIYALSVIYGQRNQFEINSAKALAEHFMVKEHKIIEIDLRTFGGSSLTSETPVEKGRSREQIANGVPTTYVPARNTLFLSYALAWADTISAENIFIGVNEIDASGYPDCRPEFIEAYTKVANLGTRMGAEEKKTVKIHTPLINLSKAKIIAKGLELKVPYELTNTCYDPNEKGIACGKCDSCTLRQFGFEKLGKKDPLPYQ